MKKTCLQRGVAAAKPLFFKKVSHIFPKIDFKTAFLPSDCLCFQSFHYPQTVA
jgi:hypothetical protein